ADRGFVAASTPKGTVHLEALKIARQIVGNVDGVTRPLTQALRVTHADLEPVLQADAARQAQSYATKVFRERITAYLHGWYTNRDTLYTYDLRARIRLVVPVCPKRSGRRGRKRT